MSVVNGGIAGARGRRRLTCGALFVAPLEGRVVACGSLIKAGEVVGARISLAGKVGDGAIRVVVFVAAESVALAVLGLIAAEVDSRARDVRRGYGA